MRALQGLRQWLGRWWTRAGTTNQRDPQQWFVDWVSGGTESAAGVKVNLSSALTYSPLWRAVALLSADVAKTPCYVYKVTDEMGGRERYHGHAAFRLLRHRANPHMTAATLKRVLTGHALLHGSGYAWINRNGAGQPLELIPLVPENTRVEATGGVVLYVTLTDNREYTLLPEDVLHVKGMSHDGLRPYSVIDKARDSLGLGLAEQRYAGKFYANDARPSLLLKHPGKLGEKASENLRKTFQREHGGVDNSFGVHVTEEGMDVTPLAINQRDAQFAASVEMSIRQVGNWTGVPPHKLGDTTRTSYNSLEQEQQRYLDEGLDPWFADWEDECWAKLLSKAEQDSGSVKIEFLRKSLIRVNAKQKAEIENIELNNGSVNVDELRAEHNRPPLPNGEGKKHRMPKNLGLIGDKPPAPPAPFPPQPQGPPPDEEEEEEENEEKSRKKREEKDNQQARTLVAQRDLLIDLINRMIRRVTTQGTGEATRDREHFETWCDEKLADANQDICRRTLLPGIRVIAVDAGRAEDDALCDMVLARFFERLRSEYGGVDTDLPGWKTVVKMIGQRMSETLAEELADMVIEKRTDHVLMV